MRPTEVLPTNEMRMDDRSQKLVSKKSQQYYGYALESICSTGTSEPWECLVGFVTP